MPFQLKCYFLSDKITKKRVLLYLKTVFFSRNDVLVPCASKIENNTKYMYLVLDEKQLNAQRHVLCTWNENLGFARPSVTYDTNVPEARLATLLKRHDFPRKNTDIWLFESCPNVFYLQIRFFDDGIVFFQKFSRFFCFLSLVMPKRTILDYSESDPARFPHYERAYRKYLFWVNMTLKYSELAQNLPRHMSKELGIALTSVVFWLKNLKTEFF